jgi:predicted alpha/beta-hydrolase family hydrolase
LLILAHGAGAGIETEFMTTIAKGIANNEIRVLRFEFPYMTIARETGKRRAPNTAKILLQSFTDIIAKNADNTAIFIGGKSMGGRIASMIADSNPIKGCVCLGYPFHPPGKPNKLRTEHLISTTKPICIIQGTRDTFGNKEEVSHYHLSSTVTVHWLENGDHSFKTRKKDSKTTEQLLQEAISITTQFIHQTIAK